MDGVKGSREMRMLLFASIIIGAALRLYPYVSTRTPFSMDSWGPLRDAFVFYRDSPIPIDSKEFDGYNNYWPALPLFTAAAARVLGLNIIAAGALLVPLVSSLSTVMAYLIATRLNSSLSVLTALLIAVFFNMAVMGGGATKEGFAQVLFLSLLYSVLSNRSLFIIAALSLGLALAHHLTTLTAFAMVAALTLTRTVLRVSGKSIELHWEQPVILLASGLGEFYLLGRRGMPLEISGDLLVSLVSHFTLFVAMGAWAVLTAKRSNSCLFVFASALVSLIPVLVVWVQALGIQLVRGVSNLSQIYVLYAVPYSILVFLAASGWPSSYEALAWLMGVLSLVSFSVFADPPGGAVLAYRLTSFAFIPLMFLASWDAKKLSRKLLLVVVMAINVAMYILMINGIDASTGWFWMYSQREVESGRYFALHASSIYSDVKQCYLLKGFYGLECRVGAPRGTLYLWESYQSVKGVPVEGGKVNPPLAPLNGMRLYSDGGGALLYVCGC
ncbi:MAG: hypothetical protein ACP5II_04605 [Infirmifilum sp.]|uniref:hypothetical protein n=1 Tax=Infirmifilum sp. TaxID=2856575 RepID=UPI00235324A1